jgi:hypothetical protein
VERSYHDALIEAAVTFGAEFWDWHLHHWGVVFEFAFGDETVRDRFRESAAVRAALDAAPNPLTGVLVYPHRGGGSGARVPRRPRPAAGAGAVELPQPVASHDDIEASVRPALPLSEAVASYFGRATPNAEFAASRPG